MGGRNPNPNPHKQTSRRLKNWDGKKKSQHYNRHSISPPLPMKKQTGSPGKDPVPKKRNKGAGVEAPLWHLYFRNTSRDPKETVRAQSRGPRWQECSKKKKCLVSIPSRTLQLGETQKKKIQGQINCQGEPRHTHLSVNICISVCLSVCPALLTPSPPSLGVLPQNFAPFFKIT